MAKTEFVLNIGDDNVVLSYFVDGKVADAWLGSPDPTMATEELGEFLATDPKAKISLLIDTLDQSFKDEELPKVSILDRRKVLSRHITMAFPGANLRGAKLVGQGAKNKTLYQFAAVPLDGRIPGWLDFIESYPNPKGGIYSVASEGVDLAAALTPVGLEAVEDGNHWRHVIGINIAGGLRQIIEKNGRLCLTRLTQAPPPETPPDEFADMIGRDFKATITYIRRLGYQVGEPLDLVILTTDENKDALNALTWDGARSVTIYTPFEAGQVAGLGSLGKEDQAFCDVLHAAWFTHKSRKEMPLSRSAAIGDFSDDLRDLGVAAAPYVAGVLSVAVLSWTLWTGYDTIVVNNANADREEQLAQLKQNLSAEDAALLAQPYKAAAMRNVLEVNEALQSGDLDYQPVFSAVVTALDSDAIVLNLDISAGDGTTGRAGQGDSANAVYVMNVDMRLADVITRAEEAVQVARRLEARLRQSFGNGHKITMTKEPVSVQSLNNATGSLFTSEVTAGTAARSQPARTEQFYVGFQIVKARS